MKTIIFSMFCLVAFSFTGCEKQDSGAVSKEINLTTEQKQIVASSNSFGLDIFKQIVSNSKEGENVFVSPLSVSMALSMLYNGAASQTKTELKEGLGYVGLSDTEVNEANRDLIKALIDADPKVAMEIANSIWYKNTFAVEPSFLAVNKDYLSADVRSAKFDAATKDLINSWVSDKTHQKIKTIVDEIRPETVMYLINAIYFKGVWKYQFDTKNTAPRSFYLTNGTTKQVDFMMQEGSFDYYQNDLFTAVDLPYGKGNYSMMVLVPKAGNTYKSIVSAMNGQNWSTWTNSLGKINKMKVYLPKFRFSFKKELNDDLSAMGMPTMFTENANLSGISKSGQLAVSKVMHKSFVDVNEEGTEAAAVTSVEIILTSVPETPVFSADKPFVFVIHEKNTKTFLFMGVVNEPLLEN
jgi:serpin B